MKLTFYIVLIVIGMMALAMAESIPSEKEILREENKLNLAAMVGISHVDHCLFPLNQAQRDLIEDKIKEFSSCLNTTIDALFDNLDDDIQRKDFSDLTKARKYIPQMCAIFDSGLQCYRNFAPTFNLCLNDKQKYISDNLITISPIFVQSACLQNGTRFLEFLEHDDGIKCFREEYDWLAANDIFNLFLTKKREMLTDCIAYNRLQIEMIRRIDECSPAASNIAKPMLSQFCRGTQCQKYVADLNCL